MSNTAEAPQDSVLRRHWQASREIQQASGSQSTPAANNTTSSGGFFSWLKSLFS